MTIEQISKHDNPSTKETTSLTVKTAQDFCIKILSQEFTSRSLRNHQYSLRAFARDLGVSPASLSNILCGKQSISRSLAESMSSHLLIPDSSKEIFILSADYCSTRSALSRKSIKQRLCILLRDETSRLDLDAFTVIQDPMHFAVLECLKIPTLNDDLNKIANFLGIDLDQAHAIAQRLQSVKLVYLDNGKLIPTVESTYTFPKASNFAIQNYHAAILARATDSLRNSIETRTFCSLLTACSREERKNIEKKLNDFMKKLEFEIETSTAPKNDVCAIGFFDFSLERSQNEKSQIN